MTQTTVRQSLSKSIALKHRGNGADCYHQLVRPGTDTVVTLGQTGCLNVAVIRAALIPIFSTVIRLPLFVVPSLQRFNCVLILFSNSVGFPRELPTSERKHPVPNAISCALNEWTVRNCLVVCHFRLYQLASHHLQEACARLCMYHNHQALIRSLSYTI